MDDDRDVYIAGVTSSTDFPTRSPFQAEMGSTYDAFIMKIDFDLEGTPVRTVAYASYLGGDSSDYCYDIALDSSRNIYLTGDTSSSNFPGTSTSAIQSTKSSGTDAFIARISDSGGTPSAPEINVVPASHDFNQVAVGASSPPLQVTLSNIGTDDLSISSIALETGSDYTVSAGGASPCSDLSPRGHHHGHLGQCRHHIQ